MHRDTNIDRWPHNYGSSGGYALAYLNIADNLPDSSEVESDLLDHVPIDTKRILDLGTSYGKLAESDNSYLL
ncbi:MAG: hypothetical protein WBP64_09060 [Nitrososphaeraceae archaeon]|jgi:hypothetical protein